MEPFYNCSSTKAPNPGHRNGAELACEIFRSTRCRAEGKGSMIPTVKIFRGVTIST